MRFASTLKTLAACALLALMAPAHAQLDEALTARLTTRFAGDRTGACAVAAVVEPQGVKRALACAGTRADAGPALDDAFEIGSISKTMTAFLVADLIAAGQWTLDDPIEQHLPPLPSGSHVPSQGERKILVRDLLTHSSGLPRLPPGFKPRKAGDPYAGLSEQELLASLAESRLQGRIGAQSVYSNFGMMVLSLAVARAHQDRYGGDFERVLTERLFKPLQMDGAYVAKTPPGVRLARGHLPGGDVTPPWTWAAAPNAAGVGGVRARLDDMVRYAQAHLGLDLGLADTPIATPLAARLRMTQAPLARGLGMNWYVTRTRNQDLVVHDGGTGGFSSLMAMEPATRRAVIVLVDTALGDLNDLGPLSRALMDDQLPVPASRRAVPMPESLRKALVGEFDLAGPSVRVRDEDGRLIVHPEGQAALEMRLDGRGDLYPATSLNALATPIFEGGAVNRVIWRQGGPVLEAVRKGHAQPLTAQNPAWRDWAGEYRLSAQFSIRFYERAGELVTQGTGQPPLAVEVTGADRVEVARVGSVVEFQRDGTGAVTGLTLRQNGQVTQGVKLPSP